MAMGDRYARQRGLVVQDLVMDAQVSVHGTGKSLPYLLQCLAALGIGTRHGRLRLCLADREVSLADVAYQFLLRPEDIGSPLGEALVGRLNAIDPAMAIDVNPVPLSGVQVATPTAEEVAAIARQGGVAVWGQVLPTSVHIGGDPVAGDGMPTVLTAALAAVCGGLTAQTVLGLLGAVVRGPAVLSSWLEERFWVANPGIGRRAAAARTEMPALRGLLTRDSEEGFEIVVDGKAVDARVTAIVNEDTVVVNVPLRSESAGVGSGRAIVRPVRTAPMTVPTIRWSPLVNQDVVLPDRLPEARLVMCGAGALGSWASATLAATPSHGIDLSVVDLDDTVELHNLNRQVLFDIEDVGLPKARLAAQRLAGINPQVRAHALQMVIAPEHLDSLTGEPVHYEISDPDIAAQQLLVKDLSERLHEADAVLSCPDNQQTRWVLNVVAERLGVPLVNGAVDGFVGRVHVCDPTDEARCLVCWLGTSIARQADRRSCTDTLGSAPVPSIVTSAAIVGGIQTATLIALLTGHASETGRFHALDAAKGELTGYRGADRDLAECPTHLFAAKEMMASVRHA